MIFLKGERIANYGIKKSLLLVRWIGKYEDGADSDFGKKILNFNDVQSLNDKMYEFESECKCVWLLAHQRGNDLESCKHYSSTHSGWQLMVHTI